MILPSLGDEEKYAFGTKIIHSISLLYNITKYMLPAERGIKPFAEMPISDRVEDLCQCFVLKAVDRDDVQVTS